MALKPEQKRDLKKTNKRLIIFLLVAFFIDAFIAFLIYNYIPKIHPVLCGFIIIVITAILYLLFFLICAKIDKRREERIKNSGKQDPFTH